MYLLKYSFSYLTMIKLNIAIKLNYGVQTIDMNTPIVLNIFIYFFNQIQKQT